MSRNGKINEPSFSTPHPGSTSWWWFWLVSWSSVRVSRWRHQMEIFSALLTLCAGNSPVKGNDAGLWCFLWSAPWINGWVNNREAGDLRRHRAHYDVIVMMNLIAILRQGQSKMLIIWLHRQPGARVQVERLDSTLHLVTIYICIYIYIYILVDSSIHSYNQYRLNTMNMLQAGVCLLLIYATAVQDYYAFYLFPTWQYE